MLQRVEGPILAAVVALFLAAGCSDDDETPTGSGPEPLAESGEPADTPGADLRALPARKSCGHFRVAPPDEYPLINVEVVKGRVPCRVARRVLRTQYRYNNLDATREAARPWVCAGPEGLIVCHKNPGPHHKAIRARFPLTE